MAKFVSCRKCHNKARLSGYISTIGLDGYEKYIECECHIKWRKDRDISIRLSSSGLSQSDLDYTLDQYVGTKSRDELSKLEKYVSDFGKYSSEVLYFFGPNGTQKTTLAKWAGSQLLSQGKTVQYILMQNLVKALTTLDDEEREDKVRKYYDCDLLIIDEVFDKNKITLFKSGFQIPFLDQFIRDRIDTYKKGLILISNKPISEIDREGFGYSLQDFIERRVILKKTQFNFEDNYMSGINIKNIQGVFD